ncbi:MAG TPA: phosphoribosylformylglycinamidine synthase subunit PurL [Candidatus Syntrophosphaera sp.]|jgi:phosphoribosylformylglycinamidine synthase|nr:phosphoribosylformylglycinamidine synthase subunit PurL [Candidatus Syntrophosphaera thermopropionivorans]HQB50435.1 phosphoribosylformylglycinamidine synthase subunit PurL [Candidatus Cloacimonas sp.]HQM79386.1 phosphoribosylformylglycinamidine synthase subunit PurL [Candidatus Syntrophosphaera sp.]
MEPEITKELIASHGILDSEYQYILDILKRPPTYLELGIFSVMWSEHASYKNSINLIKTLPREGKYLLAKAGEENAGVVDIGDGLAICFKIESHNHPSALEPYHGAATGVGGILRDIFTMGARPVAVLDSLRFGNPENPKVIHLLKEVVHGISDYGNCFGVPTVGGEVFFDEAYEGNPLVNVMAVGVAKQEHLAKSSAQGIGNFVVYVGAKTGRDGIHGATFASVELSDQSATQRTAVQVGDPFYEKLLLEATLEVIQAGLVVAIQDMGAAGLTCSSSEMAGKGGVGIELDLEKVPVREKGMTPYEIMLSESQERMLMIVEPKNLEEVQKVFQKWDLDAVVIGSVTSDKMLRVKFNGKILAEIPAEYLILGGKAPVYTREAKKPSYIKEKQSFNIDSLPEPENYISALYRILSEPSIASKKPIFSQYDYMVQIATKVEPGSDAAVVVIKGTDKAIALSTDCNARFCYLDPYEGAKAAVVEAALNVACSGGKPIAITNCLNFGNPYKPQVFWTFSESIRGMKDACIALETPVTGGNVSFYNENPDGAIYPTPVIGMLGLLEDYKKATTQWFKHSGDIIALLGNPGNELGASQYLKTIFGTVAGKVPPLDLKFVKKLIDLLLNLIEEDVISSAHNISEGGLLVCVAECCFQPEDLIGADLNFPLTFNKSVEYFGESLDRVIISFNSENLHQIKSLCDKYAIPLKLIGTVSDKPMFRVNQDINVSTEALYKAYQSGIKIN